MPRYVAVAMAHAAEKIRKEGPTDGRFRPRSWYDFGEDHQSSPQPLGQPNVYDRGPVDTGLLDKHGNKICRMPDEIGFVERK